MIDLELFSDHFLTGKGPPGFAPNGTKPNEERSTLSCESTSINVLGSHIYRGDSTPVIPPDTLFDELHAVWFIEFLQGICKNFIDFTASHARPDQSSVAIVIDNSPGYVGIGPSVQDWRTDLGPECGKFLMLSSPDPQDLLSCARAVHEVHTKVAKKLSLALTYSLLTDKSAPAPTSKDLKEDFFVRLIDAEWDTTKPAPLDTSGDPPAYFLHPDHIRGAIQPSAYQRLIINRIPEFLSKGMAQFLRKKVIANLKDEPSSTLQQVTEGPSGDRVRHLIQYEPRIGCQFLISLPQAADPDHLRRPSDCEIRSSSYHTLQLALAAHPD